MFDNIFIWAQVVGLIATVAGIFSMQLKKSRHIIFCNVPLSALWGLQYLMLGAPLGAIMNLCAIFRDTGLTFFQERYVPYFVAGFFILAGGLGFYYFEFWYDILPLIGGLFFNLTLLQRDNRALIVRAAIIRGGFWIAYNFIVGSWVGVGCCSLFMTSTIIGMYRHEHWNLNASPTNLLKSLFAMPNITSKKVAHV